MEKPRVFIGSSVEGIDIAYAIQENLEHISETTVWSQGIFELNSNALDDLINVLSKTDFGIFVFSPDDITKIRENTVKTTRDNVVFELGLFMGFLGKKRVAFLTPRNTKNFHLPSDLTGITPGLYTPDRKDGNLQAALGPFCNQVKRQITNNSIINITNFNNDNEVIKRIVVLKPENWEFILTMELLKVEIENLNRAKREIEYDLYISKPQTVSIEEFIKIVPERGETFSQLLIAFRNNYMFLTKQGWGKPGESGDENLIKESVLRMVSFGFKALEIEKEIKGYNVPTNIQDLKEYSFFWYKPITDAIQEFYDKLDFYFHDNNPPDEALDFNLKMDSPENLKNMISRISELTNDPTLLT